MKIEIFSDYSCPYCYVGKKRLLDDLKAVNLLDKVNILYRSYWLAPQAKRNTGQSIYESLAKRKGLTLEQAHEAFANMKAYTESFDLPFNPDKMIPTNLYDALRLGQYANTEGMQLALADRLFEAIMVNGEDIGDHDVLKRLTLEIGMDASAVEKILSSDHYGDLVKADDAKARAIPIASIPFFIVNDTHYITGSDQTKAVVGALRGDSDDI